LKRVGFIFCHFCHFLSLYFHKGDFVSMVTRAVFFFFLNTWYTSHDMFRLQRHRTIVLIFTDLHICYAMFLILFLLFCFCGLLWARLPGAHVQFLSCAGSFHSQRTLALLPNLPIPTILSRITHECFPDGHDINLMKDLC
jgi:hypothetical protein